MQDHSCGRQRVKSIRHLHVIPAKAGIQEEFVVKRLIKNWIPAYAGMTERELDCASNLHAEFRGNPWGAVSEIDPRMKKSMSCLHVIPALAQCCPGKVERTLIWKIVIPAY
jgi:hypothetical protein